MQRYSVIFLFLVCLLASADEPQFLVRTWKSDEGLQGNIVRSIGQTGDGYLWVATSEGLARFDGLEFTPIPAAGEWRGRPLDFFRVFTPADGSVWVSTIREGLFKLKDGELACVIPDHRDEHAGRVTSLFVRDGKILLMRGGRAGILAGDRVEELAESGSLTNALAEEAARQSKRGRYDNDAVPDGLETRSGDRWIIENGRLFFHSDSGGSRRVVRDLTGDLNALDLLEDREGNLWIASRTQGLVRVRAGRVANLETDAGPYSVPVITAMRDREGGWWIARADGGVDRVRGGKVTFHRLFTSNTMRTVVGILEDRSGRIWFTTRNASVFYWDTDEQDFEAAFPHENPGKLPCLAEDDDGAIWFGGRDKLMRWDGKKMVDLSEELPDDCEITTMVSAEGSLFLGTQEGRLIRFDGDRAEVLARVGSVPNPHVSGILPVDEKEIWFTSTRSGLHLWQEGRVTTFDGRDGLPDERVTGLAAFDDDELWLGSLGGILRVSRAELTAWEGGKGPIPRWLRLDRGDGMRTRECTGGGQPGVIPQGGTLWFPTMEGLAGVSPGSIRFNHIPPVMHLDQVAVDGLPLVASPEELHVGPGRTSLAFRFTGLSLTAPGEVTYRTRLIGLEEGPQFLGTQREITYAAVPPGKYRLEITASNGDGVATPAPFTLPVVIRPHFWQQPVFIALVSLGSIALALLAGWLVARRRMKRKLAEANLRNALENERSRISRDLHDDLGASLTELSILTELAAEDPAAGPLFSSLEELSLKSKRAVGALDEIVWATSPEQDSLRSLVEYVSFFAREFLKVVGIPLYSDVQGDLPDLSLGPRRRHNIILATREAINNAVKYAEPEFVRLDIAIEDGRLVIRIRDEGRGFVVAEVPRGNGLANMRARMADCGGMCLIESSPRKGTTVTLSLPLTA